MCGFKISNMSFKIIFTWWNRQTFGTFLKTLFFGKFVGSDDQGNRYYQSKKNERWVIYVNSIEPTKITPYYDSLIAKVICKGRNRTEAIQRTLRSLDEFVLEGITTTIDLHKKILNHEKFIKSDFDTNWLAREKFY